ncbi:MAG: family 10 glycosylhydrolase, partial [Inhella sp.]
MRLRHLITAFALLACLLPGGLRAADLPVRGVWVAGPQHNGFWRSREAMRAELQAFRAAGLNSVYAVMLLPGRTLYPSDRMAAITGFRQLEGLGNRDLMQELLDEAKPLGLRVIAWLEFGFASHHGGSHGLLQQRPAWTALGRDGKPVVKNGFHWMNAFDPEVQQLLIDLSLELLQRYPRLDGIQGDDRLPALPSSAGYHPALLAQYAAQGHWQADQAPPAEQDAHWLQWRADQLTEFLARWRAAIKAQRPTA